MVLNWCVSVRWANFASYCLIQYNISLDTFKTMPVPTVQHRLSSSPSVQLCPCVVSVPLLSHVDVSHSAVLDSLRVFCRRWTLPHPQLAALLHSVTVSSDCTQQMSMPFINNFLLNCSPVYGVFYVSNFLPVACNWIVPGHCWVYGRQDMSTHTNCLRCKNRQLFSRFD